MRSIQILLTCVLALATTMVRCADDSVNGLGQNSAALTEDCVSGCLERGVEEARCAEVCASIGGEGCVTRCTERGGDEAACTDRCDASGSAACFDGCIDAGGDIETCRLACWETVSKEPIACPEGDELERNGVIFVCTDGIWVEK